MDEPDPDDRTDPHPDPAAQPGVVVGDVAYPITGIVWGGLEPSTAYEFQVRLIRWSTASSPISRIHGR